MIADLGEEYREVRTRRSRVAADLWYWSQALRLIRPFLMHRLRGGSPVFPAPERASMLDTLRQDVTFALRTFAATPAFTLAAIAALGVGIGTNTAIFSVVYGVLQGLPYPGGERIVLAYEGDTANRVQRLLLSPPEVLAIERLEGEVFDVVAGYRYGSGVIAGDPHPEMVNTVSFSHDFMPMLESQPLLGRGFGPDDDPEDRVLILGYELWQRRFGGAEDAVGQEILLSDVAYEVVGVSSPEFTYFNDTNRVYLPLVFGPSEVSNPNLHNVYPLARLRAGFDFTAADERVATAVAAAQAQIGHRTDVAADVWLHSLYDAWVGSVQRPLLVLMGAVGLLVLVACSNVASLQLARGLNRGREIALRLALGAGRARVIRQLVTESALLAGAGGVVGLLVGWLTVGWLRNLVQSQLPRTENISVDTVVLAFTFGLSMFAGIASGLAPALLVTGGDLRRPLAEAGASVAGRATGGRLRGGLLVVQLALAVVLAVGPGLLVRSFNGLQARDLGYEPEGVLVTPLFLGVRTDYREPERITGFIDQLVEEVAVLAEVESAGVINMPPGVSGRVANQFVAEHWDEEADPMVAHLGVVTPGTLEMLGVRLVQGRHFQGSDNMDASPVALVNEAMARRLWPGEKVLGRRLKEEARAAELPWVTVVGVVGDIRQTQLGETDTPRVYRPFAQRPQLFAYIVTRLDGPSSDFAEHVRAAVASIDPGLPVPGPLSMTDLLDRVIASERVNSALVSLFAVLALVLAALGEYAVIQYLVVQRHGEIGIRMALGAGRARVLSMVLGQGLLYAAIGIGLGLVVAGFASRLIASLLHGVEATDPTTYAGVALLLLAVAIVACVLPARRATRIDPATALRRG